MVRCIAIDGNDLFYKRDQLMLLINERAGMQLVNAIVIR